MSLKINLLYDSQEALLVNYSIFKSMHIKWSILSIFDQVVKNDLKLTVQPMKCITVNH